MYEDEFDYDDLPEHADEWTACEDCGRDVPYEKTETYWYLDWAGREVGAILCPECYDDWQTDNEIYDELT